MDVTVTQAQLRAALKPAADIANNDNPHPVHQMMLLTVADGNFVVQASDRDRVVSVTVEGATVDSEGSVLVPAKHVADTIATLPPETELRAFLTETAAGKQRLVITGPGCEFNVASFDPEDFPILPAPTGVQFFSIPREDLLAMIRLVARSMADDQDAAMAGALVEIKKGNVGIVATDRFRIARAAFNDVAPPDLEVRQTIGRRPVETLAKLLSSAKEESVELGFSDKHVFLQTPTLLYAGGLLAYEFVQWRDYLPEPAAHKRGFAVKREDFLAAIQQCANFVSFESLAVEVLIRKDEIIIQGASVEKGNATRTLPAELAEAEGLDSLEGVDIAFPPAYVAEYVRNMQGETILCSIPRGSREAADHPMISFIEQAGNLRFFGLVLLSELPSAAV